MGGVWARLFNMDVGVGVGANTIYSMVWCGVGMVWCGLSVGVVLVRC